MTKPLTDQQLDEIEALAAHLYEYADQPEEADTLADVHVPELVAEVRRLRAPRTLTPAEHSAAWHAIEGTAGEDGADAGTILNAVLDRLGIAPPTAADEMAASLRRNGFKPGGTDAELAGVQATDKEPPAEACGKCKTPFDPTDIRFVDSRARYRETPYCRSCVDRCHDSTDAFHRCVICDS